MNKPTGKREEPETEVPTCRTDKEIPAIDLTLRDWFAGQAMQSLISKHPLRVVKESDEEQMKITRLIYETIAKSSYR